jgi:hypothetical protein
VNCYFFLRLAGVPYAAQHLGHTGPGPASGGPRFPSSPALAPPPPPPPPALFGGFSATMPESDFSRPRIGIYGTTADVGALI